MANFICKVMTPQGQVTTLKLEEEDKISCVKRLKANGMNPISVEQYFEPIKGKKVKATASVHSNSRKKIRVSSRIKINEKVTLEDIKKFTQDFLVLKNSDFNDKQIISTIIINCEKDSFRKILYEIQKSIKNGGYIYEIMEKHRKVFPAIYTNYFKSGELTNSIEDALVHAIKYLEEEEELDNKINMVLLPNIVMFVAIIVMLIVAMVIGIPIVHDMFMQKNTIVEVPKITKVLYKISKFISKFWIVFVLAIIIVIILFRRWIRTKSGRLKFDKFKYTNVVMGKLVYLLDFSRVLRSIYINMKNGLRLQDAIEISKNSVNNAYLISQIENSISNVFLSKYWIEPFEKDKVINPIIIAVLKKTKNEKEMVGSMEKALDYMNVEIDEQMARVLKLLPEISNVIVGLALIMFTIVIVLPCIQVYLGGYSFI